MAKAQTDGSTEAQKLFAYAYFNNGGNATKAAIEAGYAEKSATQAGSRLLTYDNVKAILSQLQTEIKERAVITKERIAEELVKIGLGDLRALFDENSRLLPVRDWPDDAAASISSVEVDELFEKGMDGMEQVGETKKLKRESKLQALKQLTELYGYNAPIKQANTDPQGNPIAAAPMQVEIVKPIES